MLETLEKISKIVINTSGVWGPVLFIVLLKVLPKIWPKSDTYFRKGYLVLKEVDDVTDSILEEYDNLEWVNTLDDFVNYAIKKLEKRYDLEDETKEQVKERIKANVNRKEGWKVNWEDGVGKIEFNKKF